MGVIINSQERKSVVEQVEENSKYKGKLVETNYYNNLKIYKKDIPCFVRLIMYDIDDSPLKICKGNGGVIDTFEYGKENTIVDYIIMKPETGGANVYKVNGNSLQGYWSAYGTDDLVLSSAGGYKNYFMVIPLKYGMAPH
jgi:hypothetical protein